jgi:cyanophycin synthetase
VVLEDGAAVLNAADAAVLEMAPLCIGEVLLYAEDSRNAALQTHREAGRRVVFMNGSTIMQAHGNQSTPILDIDTGLRPAARGLPTAVLLAAVAAAWALGLDPDIVATGLETFEPAASELPLSA